MTFSLFARDTFCTHQGCEVGPGFGLSVVAATLYFLAMLAEAFMPRADPFLRPKPKIIDENKITQKQREEIRRLKESKKNKIEKHQSSGDMEAPMGSDDEPPAPSFATVDAAGVVNEGTYDD